MKITASQLRSIIREEVQKTLTSRRRALRETDEFDYADEPYLSTPENSSASLDDYISRAVQDIKAGTHPVTGEPLTGAGVNIPFEEFGNIVDDLVEGYEDGELDYGKTLVKLAIGIRS
jgi:hypothetical protein